MRKTKKTTTPTARAGYRLEEDLLGTMEVPNDAYYGIHTLRAIDNFTISRTTINHVPEFIRGMVQVKKATALANRRLHTLPAKKCEAIVWACDQILDKGRCMDQFPIDVFQGGAGTSLNMNTNEVIASIAAKNGVEVHPNDDVNMGQSSNDTFPTATHVAATEAAVKDLIPGLKVLQESLAKKAKEWENVVKSGRTHLMDAVPVTLGQEFSGYARQIQAGIERVEATLPRLGELPIGGTAVGTGLNTPADFGGKVTAELVNLTGVKELRECVNHFEAQANRDGLVEFSGAMRSIAVSLTKMANDIRWMGSGPLTGLAEIHLPDLQPGSSIMPGKVNPVLCETATQVAAQVIGNDAAVAFGGAQGAFELNVFIPMMARNVLESARLLGNTARVFATKLVDGIEPNEERMKTLAESSPSIVTPLNSAIGYENAAKVAKTALKEGKTIRQMVIDLGFVDGDNLTEEELDKRLNVLDMCNTDRDQ